MRSRRSAARQRRPRRVMPCTAVASAGIGREGRTSRAYRPVSTPSASRRTTASETISSTPGVVPVVSQSKTAYADGARHVCALTHRADRADLARDGHAPSMSGASDGGLTARARWLTGDAGRRTDTHVHLLFLDESGQLSERRFFALGGVALRDRDWHAAARPLAGDARRARLAGRPGGQVARHPHRRGAAAARGRGRRHARRARPSAAT